MFCANYSSQRGSFPPCKNCWCAGCFTPVGNQPFPIKRTLDEDGIEIKRGDDDLRFLRGRDGDHLMTPYQCELCHFRNIQKRDPVQGDSQDLLLMQYARRVSLDAFWSRESSTVAANLGQVKRICLTEAEFGMKIFSPMGPFPIDDGFGMGPAIALLSRSLDPGRYDTFVQWATFRKVRSTVTNVSQAGAGGLGDVIGAYERNRTWISSVATHQFFYSRFMTGIHKRVGEVVKRDEPITIEVLKYIQDLLESKWKAEISKPKPDLDTLLKITRMGLWFIGGFCAGFRGEEHLILEFAGTSASLEYLTKPPPGLPPHFEFVVAGRTKNNKLSGAKFRVPVAAETAGTGLKPGIWAHRYCNLMKEAYPNKQPGYLFQRNLASPKLFEFEEDFYSVLEEVQTLRPDLIASTIDVRDDFGILRSTRRGVSGHVINMNVDPRLVNAVNRWRVEKNADVPALDMPNMYARLDLLKPTVLRYSIAL